MFEYKSYNTGKIQQNLVIFLHGYNGTIADHQYAVDWLRNKLLNSCLIVPQAPEACDKNPQKFQWFGMMKYDPNNRRSDQEISSNEIFTIYNAAGKDVALQAGNINTFIDNLQKKFHINDTHTFLIGFSQGAMLTIYTALTRNHNIGGAFALSGLVAGTEILQTQLRSYPPLYLFHGEDDMKVQFKTLPDSLQWLKTHHINVCAQTYKNLAHRMIEDEIEAVAQKINASI